MADVYPRTIKKSGIRVWYADCYYVVDGRRVRKQRSTGIGDDGSAKAKRTAELAAADIERALALGQGRQARPTTLAQGLDASIEKMELAQRSEATIEIALQKAPVLFRFFGAKTRLSDITEERVADFVRHEFANKKKSSTVRLILIVLRKAFNASGVERPRFPELGQAQAVRERFLTIAEQRRLLAVTSAHRRLHILAYLRIGCRKSELWKITSVNWERHEMRVRGTKTRGSDRTVAIDDELFEAMLVRRNERELFTPWNHHTADWNLKKWCARADIPGPISFNTLRHTFATAMAIQGVPILALAKTMGTSMKMIESVYAHVAVGDHMHEMISKLPRLTRESGDTTKTQTRRSERT